MNLSDDQAQALEAIQQWWKDKDAQIFSLAGYAGTGKTTITAHIRDWFRSLDVQVLVGAPTGKAAQRLREKGVDAETIHKLAYTFNGVDLDGELDFSYRGMGSKQEKVIIIDEASMVGQKIYDDLVGGGYRILFVGDHGQLPPVGKDPGIMRLPDFTLSKIHRTDDKGLLDFAHALREGQWLPEAKGAASIHTLQPFGGGVADRAVMLAADNLICWKNSNRHQLNDLLLRLQGHLPKDFPNATHKEKLTELMNGNRLFPVVCLRNNYRHNVFNGEVFSLKIMEVTDQSVCGELSNQNSGILAYKSGEAFMTTRPFDIRGFGMDPKQKIEIDPGMLLFDYGCCLTAHKSQGSEWPSVAVYDDTTQSYKDRARWAYTAATRAEKELVWLKR